MMATVRFGNFFYLFFDRNWFWSRAHFHVTRALFCSSNICWTLCYSSQKKRAYIFGTVCKKKMQYIVTVALKYKMAKVHFRKVVDRGSSLKPRTFQRRTCFVLLRAASTTWQSQSTQIRLKDCCWKKMKPAVDEMFPEGAGPYVDLDEVCSPVSVSK